MRKFLIPVALGVAALILPASLGAQKNPPAKTTRPMTVKEIVQHESPAIVSIYNLDAKGDVRSTGTGFIVRSNGIVVTNFHVIEGASGVLVKMKNGEVYDRVTVVDFDKRRDIAVLHVKAIQLPTVTLAASTAKIEPGDRAIAIGNPKGLDHTVSDGLVSARRVDLSGYEGISLFQITTPISPGSSGGPLYNENGEVIGITTMYLKSEGAQNLNFAVDLKYVIPMLETHGEMTFAELAAKTGQPMMASQQPPPSGSGAPPQQQPPPQPQRPPQSPPVSGPGTMSGNRYTDPAGIASIMLQAGWKASPSEKGELMNLSNGPSFVFVHHKPGSTDLASIFDGGVGRFREGNSIKPVTQIVDTMMEGRPIKAQWFNVTTQKENVTILVFVGATTGPRGGLLLLAVLGDGRESQDRGPVTDMFLSLR